MAEIWFWQRIVSPHMAGLAAALAQDGHVVSYVAEHLMSDARAQQGWESPDVSGVCLHLVNEMQSIDALIAQAAPHAIHICQGIRANGMVGAAQRLMRRRGTKYWVVMETVQDGGRTGILKRAIYRLLFRHLRQSIKGVLATGRRTPEWVAARGVPPELIFPFAYFLSTPRPPSPPPQSPEAYRVLFVGRLVELKRLDLLVDAVAGIAEEEGSKVQLCVVGSGPKEQELRAAAEKALGDRLAWVGRLPQEQARAIMWSADCLVLPSRHDGWGAVTSEALMAGTPAIVSDSCGSAGVVMASGAGGVFPSGDAVALRALLRRMVNAGKPSMAQRDALRAWARALGAPSGARYLSQILLHTSGAAPRPDVPWAAAIVSDPEGLVCR